MTEQKAREQGFEYLGVSDLSIRDRERFDIARKELKAQGYKTVIVNERVSQYSRSGAGIAYRSIYVEHKYFVDRAIGDIKKRLASVDAKKANALQRYNEELVKIDEEAADMAKRLEELIAQSNASSEGAK